MEDNSLLEQLKGQRWERITAAEDKGLKSILVALEQPTQIPYMYSDELKLQLIDHITEEQTINGFSGLKKLGLLQKITILVRYLTDISQKSTYKDLIQKISQELGKLKVTRTLKFFFDSYVEGQENILNDLSKIEKLEKLQIGQRNQESEDGMYQFMKGYAGILSKVVECTNLKSLSLQLYNQPDFNQEFKSLLQNISKLTKLEDLVLSTSIENEEFYDAFGYQISKLPNLKRFYIQFTISNHQNAVSQVENFANGLLNLTKHLNKSLSLEEVVFDTQHAGEVEDKYNQGLDILSSLKTLKCLRIFTVGNNNTLTKLHQFIQIQELSLQLGTTIDPKKLESLKSLTQLKKLDFQASGYYMHRTKTEIAKHFKTLKNLTYISIGIPVINYKDLYRYLPSLVVVNDINLEPIKVNYIE